MKVLASKFVYSNDFDLSNFEGMEIQLSFYKKAQFFEIDHQKLKQKLSEMDIRVPTVHAPAADVFDDSFLDILRFIKREYGARVISIHPQKGRREHALAKLETLKEQIRNIGVTLAYENFPAACNKWIVNARDMHAAFSQDYLKLTYDTSHAVIEESLDEVKQCLSKIEVIHLSDQMKGDDHLPIGTAKYPVFELLSLLKEKHFDGYIVLEYMPRYEGLLRGDAERVRDFLKQ